MSSILFPIRFIFVEKSFYIPWSHILRYCQPILANTSWPIYSLFLVKESHDQSFENNSRILEYGSDPGYNIWPSHLLTPLLLYQMMSVKWAKLTDAEKAPYNELSNKDKVRYKKEIDTYNTQKKAEEKKQAKKPAESKKKETASKDAKKKDTKSTGKKTAKSTASTAKGAKGKKDEKGKKGAKSTKSDSKSKSKAKTTKGKETKGKAKDKTPAKKTPAKKQKTTDAAPPVPATAPSAATPQKLAVDEPKPVLSQSQQPDQPAPAGSQT